MKFKQPLFSAVSKGDCPRLCQTGLGLAAAWMVISTLGSVAAPAAVIDLTTDDDTAGINTTGEVLDGKQSVTDQDVPEIDGLTISAYTAAGEVMDGRPGNFGLASGGGALNAGDWIVFSFNQSVEITGLSYNGLTNGEEGQLVIATEDPTVFTIVTSGQFTPPGGSVTVAANTEIKINDTAVGNWGIQTLTLNVVPEPSSLGLFAAGSALVFVRPRR